MKFIVAIPLVFSFVSFILALLALLSGYKQNFMDDYSIMTLNTSALGQQAIQQIANGQSPTATTTSIPGGPVGSIIASATALIPSSLASEAASIIGQAGSSVADDLASAIGISEFYSIHAMDFCQGQFEPSATTPGASHNVTSCTAPLDFQSYNFTGKIENELRVGPFQLTLSDLGVSQDLQNKLNEIPKLAQALAAVYIISCILVGLSMLSTFVGMVLLPRSGRMLSLLNLLIASGAVFLLLASALVATIGPDVATQQLQQYDVSALGLQIIGSSKLQGLSWAAFVLMLFTMSYWVYEFVAECVRRRRTGGFTEKQTTYGK